MPNWVSNSVAVKGKTANVKNFLNVAFKKLGIEMPENLQEAIDILNERASINEIRLSTWKPIPADFEIDKDTTNYPEMYPELVKYQREKYGCVGWYDFNKMWFGCKWDSCIDFFTAYEYDDDIIAVYLNIETPWSEPLPWLKTLQHTYRDVVFFNCSSEESGLFYNFYDLIYQEEVSYDLDRYIEFYDGEAEDEYEIMDECLETLLDKMNDDYAEYVYSFDIYELENLTESEEENNE